MNRSQARSNRNWNKWRNSGAVGGMPTAPTPPKTRFTMNRDAVEILPWKPGFYTVTVTGFGFLGHVNKVSGGRRWTFGPSFNDPANFPAPGTEYRTRKDAVEALCEAHENRINRLS